MPNSNITTYHYNGLTPSVIGGAVGDDARRMLNRQQQDQLGRTTLLRSYTPGGGEWRLESEISLAYDAADRLTTINGRAYGYGDSGPHHAVDRIGNADRFDYDANGNMTVRNKGLAGQQTLVWDAQNRLSQVQDNNGDLLEQYWYDVDGARAKKTSGTTTTCTFFVHYEEEVTGGVTTTVSHYSFGGLRIAVKRGNDLFHLHCDHLGSTSLTTDGAGAATASRAYYAYGAERAASGVLQIDHTFTGQKRDSTGLMYYNARYYDPALGTFISPDPIIPDPGMVIDYNRFLYVRGNPFKYTDPSGRDLVCIKGGPSGMNADKNAFFLWCLEVAIRAGWDEEKHGPIHFIDNDKASTAAVADEISESRKEFPDRPIVAVGHSWGGIGVLNFARSLHADRINVDLVLVLDLEDFGRWGYTRPDQSVALSHNIEAGANLYPQHIGTEYDDIGRYDDGVNEIVYSDGTPVLNLGIGKVMTAGGFVEATHYNVFSARETIAIAAWHLMGVLGEGGGGAVDRGLLGEPLHQFL